MQLLKYSEAIGLPAVCADNGKKAGTVKDLLFDIPQKRVLAFLMERKGVEIGRKQILFENVRSLGSDALIIDTEKAVVEYSSKSKNFCGEDNCGLIGLHVFEKSGTEIGVVADLAFDASTGRIESVEVSDGLLQDLVGGRQRLPLFGRVEFGDGNMLVDREAVEEMVNNGGGIKNRLLS